MYTSYLIKLNRQTLDAGGGGDYGRRSCPGRRNLLLREINEANPGGGLQQVIKQQI